MQIVPKQKAHGPDRLPEKQFQSINTFVWLFHHIHRLEKTICFLFEESMSLYLLKNWFSFTKECFVPCLVKTCPVVLEKFFLQETCIPFTQGDSTPFDIYVRIRFNGLEYDELFVKNNFCTCLLYYLFCYFFFKEELLCQMTKLTCFDPLFFGKWNFEMKEPKWKYHK